MCTLSFLPQKDGYLLAMNRDELHTRAVAEPPSRHDVGACWMLYPQEPGGGTWIGVNSHGTLLALMNANSLNGEHQPAAGSIPSGVGLKGAAARSRGEIIPLILQEAGLDETLQALENSSFSGMSAFCLFGFFPRQRAIRQWSWDGVHRVVLAHEWIRNHWYSSSRSDARAKAQRGEALEASWRENLADPATWLRSVHSSHIPEAGAFSVCVHREDAATVSFTEVRYTEPGSAPSKLCMTYEPGNPCEPDAEPTIINM